VLRTSEAVEFARAVNPPRNLANHDRICCEAGLGIDSGTWPHACPTPAKSTWASPDGAEL